MRAREERNVNREMATGEIEVLASDLTIINRAEALPLDSNHVNTEEARLKYRYLDLRRPEMAQRPENPRQKSPASCAASWTITGSLISKPPMLTKSHAGRRA